MNKTEYGIQMYSIRKLTEESMYDALKTVAELGYKYVEFAGFFDQPAENVKKWLDELGLKCSGTHTGIDKITPDTIDDTIKYHKQIGCDTVIVPGCDWGTSLERANEIIELLNEAGAKLSENGLKLGYHNHSMEFFETPFGITFEDEVIKRTNVELEIDTFWLYNTGRDVISFLEAHKDRINVIHLKDGIASPAENKNFENVHKGAQGCSVGYGDAPVKAVREWALKNNVLMVVECEATDFSEYEEANRCISFLRSLD